MLDRTICSMAGTVGMRMTVGANIGADAEGIPESDLVLLWGTNTLTSNPHLWPFVLQARERGAPIIAIDPLRTRTAAQCDEWLPIRPGTDAALALVERTADYAERIRGLRRLDVAGGPASVLDRLAAAGIGALEHLRGTTPPEQIERAVALLAGAGAVHVVGQRRSFAVAAYLSYAIGQLGLRARARFTGAGNEEYAGADEENGREERHDQLAQLFLRERHGRLFARMMVKRGASFESRPPMSPVSVPSEVTSKGSWVRRSW